MVETVRKKNKRLRRAPTEEPFPSEAQAAFQRLVMDFNFPCLGAKAALNSRVDDVVAAPA